MSDRYEIVIGGGGTAARDRCRALLESNQETYGFPDHDQIVARLDALREQVR